MLKSVNFTKHQFIVAFRVFVFLGLMGMTGSYMITCSGLQEPLLLEEQDAGCLKVTPYSDVGLFSLATLSWLNSILSIGGKRPIKLRAILLLAPEDRSKFNYKILNTNWERLKSKKQPSLGWARAMSFWKKAEKRGFCRIIHAHIVYFLKQN